MQKVQKRAVVLYTGFILLVVIIYVFVSYAHQNLLQQETEPNYTGYSDCVKEVTSVFDLAETRINYTTVESYNVDRELYMLQCRKLYIGE